MPRYVALLYFVVFAILFPVLWPVAIYLAYRVFKRSKYLKRSEAAYRAQMAADAEYAYLQRVRKAFS